MNISTEAFAVASILVKYIRVHWLVEKLQKAQKQILFHFPLSSTDPQVTHSAGYAMTAFPSILSHRL